MLSPEKSPQKDVSPYDIFVDHDLIRRYHPKFLAKGGERFVYEIPDHPEVVAKVDMRVMRSTIEWNLAHNEAPDACSPELRTKEEEGLTAREVRRDRARTSFGREHVLPERSYFLRMPVTEEILRAAFHGEPPVHIQEAWTYVSIQHHLKNLNHVLEMRSARTDYEERRLDADLYGRLTEHFVYGIHGIPVSREEIMHPFLSDHILDLLSAAEQDAALKQALQTFVSHAITFTNQTGDILDMVGEKNILFFEKDTKWDFLLVDPLYSSPSMNVEYLRSVLLPAVKTGHPFPDRRLSFSLDYIRTLNALASVLGLDTSVVLTNDPTTLPTPEQIYALFRKNRTQEK